MKTPGWLKRLRIMKKLGEVTREHRLHNSTNYHASRLIELSKRVMPNHPGYNGVRDILRDNKTPTEILFKKKTSLEEMLKPKQQLAE